jgi:peptide methionine sulfoxide reductase msrA/msrB
MKSLACLCLMLGLLGFGYVLANPPEKRSSVPDKSTVLQAAPTKAKTPMVTVHVFKRDGKLLGPVESPKLELSAADWRKRLSPDAFEVLRNQGTEQPFSGALLDTDADGVYCCAGCGLPLFSSDAKFHSGTGWPSFYQTIAKGNVAEVTDSSDGMVRTEIHCPRCGGHLGHVFDDGPKPTGLRYCLDSVALKFTPRDKLASLADPATEKPGEAAVASRQTQAKESTATAVFASGCFWATEAAFAQINGVIHAESGYSGGAKETANYEAVSKGNTGHAESVQVTYDPRRVSYNQLLDVFFAAHDPTELNRQGNDTGTQYRSAVFYADDQQQQAADAKIHELTQAHVFSAPIVTAVEPLKAFYPAEGYHQNYVHKHPDEAYIKFVSIPKVEHVREKYPNLIKKTA